MRRQRDRKVRTTKGLSDGEGIYVKLCDLILHADARFNSGLFHFKEEQDRAKPEIFTLNLQIDDKPLREIINSLYPPGPYNFAVMPPEILGQVYEQFLGKIIRLTEGHHAKVEDKPEVKKAGGVFYTPSFIVEYIVKNTIGKQLDGKTPKIASTLRILDPACGSGSFLLGAYKYLLTWHLEWYSKALLPFLEKGEPETSPIIRKLLPSDYISESPNGERHRGRKKKRRQVSSLPIYQVQGNVWRLTSDEKKRILINNIYGVDIDPQAVEVTKLSLLLKVLEGESQETIQTLLRFSDERALPDLDNNIKCGNSIIGWDILEKDLQLQKKERDGFNPFNWQDEFPDVFQQYGFDVVIGNPPYVRMEELKRIKEYLREYQAFEPRADLYAYFIEKETNLLRNHGTLGLIVSNKWMKARYGGPLRLFIAQNLHIHKLIDFGELPIFVSASTFPCILIAGRDRDKAKDQKLEFYYAPIRELRPTELEQQVLSDGFVLCEGPNHLQESWRLAEDTILTKLLSYPEGFVPLGKWLNKAVIGWGIKTGLNEAFIITTDVAQEWIKGEPELAEVVKPILIGDEIRRYASVFPKQYIIYAGRGFRLDRFTRIKDHLNSLKERLSMRATEGNHPWYELQQPQPKYANMFEKEKIVWPEIAKEPRFQLFLLIYILTINVFLQIAIRTSSLGY